MRPGSRGPGQGHSRGVKPKIPWLHPPGRSRDLLLRPKPARVNVMRSARRGAVAQLGERSVRNAEVEGSNPFRSIPLKCC